MAATSDVLESSVDSFFASDVGLVVCVQDAGASGTPLVATALAFIDSKHIQLSVAASTTALLISASIGEDDTAALIAALLPSVSGVVQGNSDGSGVTRQIPTGIYYVNPGDLVIPNPQSGILEGRGSSFNTIILSKDPTSTDSILVLSNGTTEPHSYILRNLTLDANYGSPANGVLFIDRSNLTKIQDVVIKRFGANGVGLGSSANPILFQEMIFDHITVVGGTDLGVVVPPGTWGVKLYVTGNCEFHNGCNVEQCDNGVFIKGSYQQVFIWKGGHLERINKYAFILDCVQPEITCDVGGATYLGNAVVNGKLNLANTSPLWSTGAIVDNGFGNSIRLTASMLFQDTKAAFAPGLKFEGDEWLSVPGISDDPTFLKGSTGWTGHGATVGKSAIVMPGVKNGASLSVAATGANGYAEKTFTASADTDYLLQVGLMTRGLATYRIQVLNSTTTVWDSGNFDYPEMVGPYGANFQAFRVIRKSIPVTSDTVLKVRIYAVNSGQVTICPLLLLSQSLVRMANDHVQVGTGFSSSGSGASLVFSQNISIGNYFYMFKSSSLNNRGFIRAVVTVPAGAKGCVIGVNGDGNSTAAGPQIPLRAGETAEYTIPLSSLPPNSNFQFYTFVATGTIQVSEIGIYAVNEVAQSLTNLRTGIVRSDYDFASGTGALSTERKHLWLGELAGFPSLGAQFLNLQAEPESANNFLQALYGSNIKWNSATGKFDIIDQGSTPGFWTAILLGNGYVALAAETGLTLPTTRTIAQIEAAIKFKISTNGDTQLLTGQLRLLTGSIENWILHGTGDPNGAVNGVGGSIYLDTNGALWIQSTGSFGNTGWRQADTGFWSLVSAGIIESPDLVQLTNGATLPSGTAGQFVRLGAAREFVTGMVDLSGGDVANALPITKGGHGGSSVGSAQSNLQVYSKTTVDANIAACLAAAKTYADGIVAAEAATRASGDADLGTLLAGETSDRMAADASLSAALLACGC